MRAVRVNRLGSLESGAIEEVPRPEAGPGEVVIDVEAVSVKYVDLLTIQGRYQFEPRLPYTPGKGPAGVVSQTGPGVEGLSVGDRVLAMAEHGGYAEAALVPARQVHRIPPSLDFGGAAAMAVAYDTAWMALRDRARIRPGDSVLVLGATGAVGRAAVQLARAMGAGKVLAGLTDPSRLDGDPLGEMVDGRLDLAQPDLRSRIRQEVGDLTAGEGVDIVLDPIGGDAFDGAIRSLAWRGRHVVIGFASGRIAELRTNYVLLKNIELSGLQISDYRKRQPELVDKAFREIFEWCETGDVQPPIFISRPLDEWAEALERLSSRRAERMEVLVPSGSRDGG